MKEFHMYTTSYITTLWWDKNTYTVQEYNNANFYYQFNKFIIYLIKLFKLLLLLTSFIEIQT